MNPKQLDKSAHKFAMDHANLEIALVLLGCGSGLNLLAATVFNIGREIRRDGPPAPC